MSIIFLEDQDLLEMIGYGLVFNNLIPVLIPNLYAQLVIFMDLSLVNP